MANPIDIRRLDGEAEWIDTLAHWHQAQWHALAPDTSAADRVHRLSSQRGGRIPATWVALQAGVLLGSASLVDNDMDSRPQWSPWLASVYVHAPYRRQGVGSALVRWVVHEAERLGFKALYLFTPDQADFYRRLGWVLLERSRYRGHDVRVMRIDLETAAP